MFEIKRGTKQGDPLSSLLFHAVLRVALKDDLTRWQKEKMARACAWATPNQTASQTYVLLTTCSCSRHHWNNCRKWYVNSSKVIEKVGLRNPPRKDEHSQQPKLEQMTRSGDHQQQSRDIDYGRMCQICWANNNISATGDNWDQASNQGRLGVVLQIQARVDIKIIPPTAQTPPIQHGDHPTMSYASGTWPLKIKHAKMIQSTRRKLLQLTVHTKRKYTKKRYRAPMKKKWKRE